ncbi:hypothetical protein Cpap_1862, partial [Ruminiclostridium papyrosolvens DSM 2782]
AKEQGGVLGDEESEGSYGKVPVLGIGLQESATLFLWLALDK